MSKSNLNFVKAIGTKMNEHKFLLTYKGDISQDIIKGILALTEKKLELDGTEISLKKKVFNIMVECLQNISHHGQAHENQSKYGLIMIGRDQNDFAIYSSNLITNESVNDIKNKIETVNHASKDELSEMYKEILLSNRLSEKGTAGLGLIDIAKKSGNKLDYHFESFNDNLSYFVLRTLVKPSN